jgi:ectoine hydroxylase-related dioxygenase (phytanoyl-CoA dioxygenase family)
MTVTPSGLTAEEITFFRANGYLVGGQLFDPDTFEALRAHFEAKLALLRDDERPEDMDVPHFTDPALFRWLLHPALLDVVEGIVGPDIALFTSHFFCKPAGDGKSVPWHTDAYFWRETIQPATEAVTLWLAIDPSTLENGCMSVLPGTHRDSDGLYRQVARGDSVFEEELDSSAIDPAAAVPIQLRPNQFSLHAGGLVHSSARNTSTLRRCGFTMRYMSTAVRFNHDGVGDRHQIFLARGVDRAGNGYADPAVAHPELVETRGAGQRFVGNTQR